MKSIPLALTWEFWRQSCAPLAATTACLAGMMALLYGSIRPDGIFARNSVMFTNLHAFCFLFIIVGLAAVVCYSTGSPVYRFTLPVSVRASVLVPMLNGMIATAIGYLIIALLANSMFDARWTLVKPTLLAVSVTALCQAATWLPWQSPHLRGAMVAGLAGGLGVVVVYLNGQHNPERFHRDWQTSRPFDIGLTIVVPILAYAYSVAILALARHGAVFSISALGRRLLAQLNIEFRTTPCGTTPMSAELWAEWITRGRGLPTGLFLLSAVLAACWLSGRFEWQGARDAVIAFTWLQVIFAPVFGLFVGHVGERFDFNEHLATRPLSDMQLADVKLRNTLKTVCWSWIAWAIGMAIAIACLVLVGQGPTSRSDIVPPGTHPLVPLIIVALILLASFTLMSLGVSVSILRPWLLKSVLLTISLAPAVPLLLQFYLPESSNEIASVFQWGWIGLTIGGTLILYVMAFRLRLITTKRVFLVGAMYLLFCLAWLPLASLLPPRQLPDILEIGFILSTCILPFVCIAAVPLAIWWNRHR